MTEISDRLTQAMTAEETAEEEIVLATLSHAGVPAPIRICGHTENLESRGETYIALPFEIVLESSAEDEPPRAQVRIDDPQNDLVPYVRQASGRIDVLVEVVLVATPDVVELGPFRYQWVQVERPANSTLWQGELVSEDILNSRFPADAFTPASNPGLFS
ncbi:hypothetical protein [Algihabitans albus]|uniref:hypothetical protein n=1 Tax=Algihabitans albus TaxID=2164067 RepID=UPI0013C2A3AD|nr:hypothetical protein [Algihabitans albus]